MIKYGCVYTCLYKYRSKHVHRHTAILGKMSHLNNILCQHPYNIYLTIIETLPAGLGDIRTNGSSAVTSLCTKSSTLMSLQRVQLNLFSLLCNYFTVTKQTLYY